MPRGPRVNEGGLIYHAMNRANARLPLFESDADYALLVGIMGEAQRRVAMPVIGYCMMPNHWHMVLWPREDGDLSEFVRWLTMTHTQRWHAVRGTAGTGHIYQGRFKSFPIQQTRPPAELRAMGMLEGGDAVLSTLRYVERNALRAGLATRAAGWRWGSFAARRISPDKRQVALTEPPGGLPEDWAEVVNRPQSEAELAAIRRAVGRGVPFGREDWVRRVAAECGLEFTLRPRGRPSTRKGV